MMEILLNSFYSRQHAKPIAYKLARLVVADGQIEHTRLVSGLEIIWSVFTAPKTDCIGAVSSIITRDCFFIIRFGHIIPETENRFDICDF